MAAFLKRKWDKIKITLKDQSTKKDKKLNCRCKTFPLAGFYDPVTENANKSFRALVDIGKYVILEIKILIRISQ